MSTVGERLRQARLRRVWTQADLARESQIPIVTISRIENEHHAGQPRQSTIRRLAAALDVDPAWLLLGDEATEGKVASAHGSQWYGHREQERS